MTEEETTEQDAVAIIRAESEKRKAAFEKAYEVVCKKYRCEKVPIPRLTLDGRVVGSLETRINP